MITMHNRIVELRKARGWSMRELAQRVNASASTINAIEKGKTQLNLPWLNRLAKVFDISVEELAGFTKPVDQLLVVLQDEVVPINPNSHELIFSHDENRFKLSAIRLTETQVLCEVTQPVLDQVGIHISAVVVVDHSPDLINNPKSLDILVGKYSYGHNQMMILRQFVAPNLLITNSSSVNYPSINLRDEGVKIVGVVMWSMLPVFRPKLDMEEDVQGK
jgi:transcriptional regulator with XRE-family HTH domain